MQKGARAWKKYNTTCSFGNDFCTLFVNWVSSDIYSINVFEMTKNNRIPPHLQKEKEQKDNTICRHCNVTHNLWVCCYEFDIFLWKLRSNFKRLKMNFDRGQLPQFLCAMCNSIVLFGNYPARVLWALGLLLAHGAPTVRWGKTFWRVSRGRVFFLQKRPKLENEKLKNRSLTMFWPRLGSANKGTLFPNKYQSLSKFQVFFFNGFWPKKTLYGQK